MNRTFEISLSTILKVFFVGIGLYVLYILSDVVLVVLTAIVIASAAEPAVQVMARKRIPRTVAVLMVYLSFISVIAATAYFFLPPVLNETANLLKEIPAYANANETATISAPLIGDISLLELTQGVENTFKNITEDPLGSTSAVFGGIVQFLLIVVFSFYFSMQERSIEHFLRIVTPKKNEEYIISLWKRTRAKIGLWMQGQLILGFLIGLLTYLALTIFQVPYALILAVIAGCLELIPLFGPTLSAVPAVAIAWSSGGIPLAITVVIIYIIIQQFENHLIYPIVVTKVVGVPPVMTILSIVIGLKLGGFLGLLLAVPLAAAIQELMSDYNKGKEDAHELLHAQ
jgi:predicted PurR-regulated permease PerM